MSVVFFIFAIMFYLLFLNKLFIIYLVMFEKDDLMLNFDNLVIPNDLSKFSKVI